MTCTIEEKDKSKCASYFLQILIFAMQAAADIDATNIANPHVILPSAASFKYPPKRKTEITDTTINLTCTIEEKDKSKCASYFLQILIFRRVIIMAGYRETTKNSDNTAYLEEELIRINRLALIVVSYVLTFYITYDIIGLCRRFW